MGFPAMFRFEVPVRPVGVAHCGMVVLVIMLRAQVLEATHLREVVGYVDMVMAVHQLLMSVVLPRLLFAHVVSVVVRPPP